MVTGLIFVPGLLYHFYMMIIECFNIFLLCIIFVRPIDENNNQMKTHDMTYNRNY